MTVIIDKTSDFGVLNTTTSSESVNKNSGANKQNRVNDPIGEFSKVMVSDVSKKSTSANDGKKKSELNKPKLDNPKLNKDTAGSESTTESKNTPESKDTTDSKDTTGKKKGGFSLNELHSLLTVFYSEEKFKINSRAHGYNLKFIKELWSDNKVNQLSELISESGDLINDHIEATAEYYFSQMGSELLGKRPDGELKNKLTGNGVDKFKSKDEISLYLRSKTNADEVIKNINSESVLYKDKTKLFKSFSDEMNKFPVLGDELGSLIAGNREEITAELNSLHEMAALQDEAKDIVKDISDIFGSQRKSDMNYSKSLTILMGKIADLRNKLAQRKLENDRLIATIQQKTLQDKTDADGAEMAKKIKKAERLQALFKWLGPLLIALMVILTALTGGLLAKALAAVIVVVTIISEIVKAAGGPDIMATIMTPVTKLVEVVQKFIKDMAMKIGQKLGLPPAELKKLEEKMEIIAMVLAVVVVMAVFAAAGAVAGKVIGQVVSESVKEILRQVMVEVKRLLISMMLTSTVVNGINSVTQAELNKDVMKLNADIDLDQELLDKLMELMEKIMAAFSESQQDLNKMKEQLGKIGKDDFQRKKAIIQSGPLAV
ncbi:TPA: hypothetical protein RG701_000578 [Morganella morganii subsp. morganii]|nr:hypothetical protein [Morganella morganii subsp. morganii]